MNHIHNLNDNWLNPPAARPESLPPGLTVLLAGVAGLAVATLYYAQPMLAVMRSGLTASAFAVGAVPMLTQLGYAAGILLLAPLGDRYDRRRIILAKAAVLAAALVAGALAQSIAVLWGASFVTGLTATLAQDAVSSAATLAPEQHRGRVVGSVMTGLLLGILLSRVISGVVAEAFGWRVMLLGAAGSMAVVVALAWTGLPSIPTTTRLAYGALLGSLVELWRRHAALRRAALAQGLLAVGFSAFWSSLALMLSGTFHLGSAVAGAFGLAGAAGAVIAPVAGRLADRRGPDWVTRVGAAAAAGSFALLIVARWLPVPAHLALMVVAVVGFDLGVQAALIAHQTIVYGIEPAARSRLNAILFTVMFVGMAVGAGLGSLLLQAAGWTGVVVLATVSALAALAVRCYGRERTSEAAHGRAWAAEG